MKKAMAILLIIFSLLACITASFAETKFNYSLFSTATYDVQKDEFNGTGVIVFHDAVKRGHTFEHKNTKRYKSEITPVIIVKDTISFNIGMYYYANSWLFVNKVYIKMGDDIYTFDVSKANSRDTKNGDIGEIFGISELISVDSDQVFGTMMDKWLDYSGEIRIRYEGSKGNFDFTLKKEIQNDIAAMYKLYKQAIGAE